MFAMKITLLLAALSMVSLSQKSFAAEEAAPAASPADSGARMAEPQQFEIIDGSATITGEPDPLGDMARRNWTKACNEWKKETKDLNKKNQLMAINCASPSCASADNGAITCSSTGTYKIKTAGVLVRTPPPPPEPPPLPPEHVVQQAPPPVIVEVQPMARPGFIWAAGYWAWVGSSHVWMPGHWLAERPGYVWFGGSWAHRGPGWHFETGHWGRR